MKIFGLLDFGDLTFLIMIVAWIHIVTTLYPQDPKDLENMDDYD